MAGAGSYNRLFTHGVHSRSSPTAIGEKGDVHTAAPAALWGLVEDVAGGTTDRLDATRALTTATVRLRHFPTVKPLDRLTDAATGEVWKIVSWYRGADETVCEVER